MSRECLRGAELESRGADASVITDGRIWMRSGLKQTAQILQFYTVFHSKPTADEVHPQLYMFLCCSTMM